MAVLCTFFLKLRWNLDWDWRVQENNNIKFIYVGLHYIILLCTLHMLLLACLPVHDNDWILNIVNGIIKTLKCQMIFCKTWVLLHLFSTSSFFSTQAIEWQINEWKKYGTMFWKKLCYNFYISKIILSCYMCISDIDCSFKCCQWDFLSLKISQKFSKLFSM